MGVHLQRPHPSLLDPPAIGNDDPCVAVAFATSQPGETLADFKQRISVRDYYTRTRGIELVLDRDVAEGLVRLLIPVVGQTEVGLLIDSPCAAHTSALRCWVTCR